MSLKYFLALPLLLLPTLLFGQSTADLSVWQGNASFSGSGLDRVGAALTTGDFNGDGRWDFAIGAPGTLDNAGQVYLFYGSASRLDSSHVTDIPGQASVVITGTEDLQLGGSLHLGDLNGDGLEDLIIGAPRADNSRGEVWIIFGGDLSGEISDPDVRLVGAAAGDGFGWSVATSDVDPDDEIQDLLIGSPNADLFERDAAGRVDVILGRTNGWPAEILLETEAVYATIAGAFGGGKLGYALARASSFQGVLLGNDMNSDGVGDIVMGAPGQNFGGRAAAGFVHMFLSSDSVVDTTDLSNTVGLVNYRRLAGATAFDGLGRSLSAFTVSNRRGILVGSPAALVATSPAVRAGAVYEVNWGTINTQEGVVDLSILANVRMKIMSTSAADSFGVSLASTGSAWSIGASGTDPFSRSFAGMGHVFTGPPAYQGYVFLDSLSVRHTSLAGAASQDRIGASTAVGDLNGDGVMDALVGSPAANNYSGMVYIYRGGQPYAWSFTPSSGQTSVPISTSIQFSARDESPGLNPDLTYININNQRYLTTDPEVSWESENGRFSYLIEPSEPFAIDVPIPVQIQVSDNNGSRSAWYSYQFVTGRDDRAPEIEELSPDEEEINVATTRNIEFTLSDPGSGVDSTTVSLRVVFPGSDETIAWGDPRLTATGPRSLKRFTFNPDVDFPADEIVNVTLRASDLTTPPNSMTPFDYHFSTISDTVPPVINQIIPAPGSTIDQSTSIYVRIQDESAGVDTDGTTMIRTQNGNPENAGLGFQTITDGYLAVHTPGGNPFETGPLVMTFRTQDLANPPNEHPDSSWSYTVVQDTVGPRLAAATPSPFSEDAARNTLISLRVLDNAAGVDSASIGVTIAGQPINHQSMIWETADNRSFNLQYQVNPNNPFPDTVRVRLVASDQANPPNSLDTTYYFTTEMDTTRPEFLLIDPAPGSDGVSVTQGFVWEVADNLSGVDPSSLFLIVDDAEQTSLVTNSTNVTQPGAEYSFYYSPANPFQHEDTLRIRFDIYDHEVPANRTRLDYELFTEPDEDPPYLADRSPYDTETGVSRGADILFKILDQGLGVELDSLILFVEEQFIPRTSLSIEEVDSGYVVRYNPPTLFAHLDTIDVRVVGYDQAGIPNRMDERYWFLTLSDDREPPYLVDIVPEDSTSGWPVDAGLEFTILDDGQGVDSTFTRIELEGNPGWRYDALIERVDYGFHYTLNPIDNWLYSDTAGVLVRARDTAEPPNEMTFPKRITLFIARDDQSPVVVNQQPPPDSGFTINRFLEFDLMDDLAGVDTSSVQLTVNDVDVLPLSLVEATPGGFHYRYRPESWWTIGDHITVSLTAADSSAGKNSGQTVWEFDIVPDEQPPYVPVDSLYPAPDALDISRDDTLRILILDDGIGIDGNSLSVTVAGRSISDIAAADTVDLGYEYLLPLQRLNLFAGQLAEVRVQATDRASPTNRMQTFSYQFAIEPPEEDFSVVPRTITPNGDGVWDEALIYHLGGAATDVTVFDIRGRQIATFSGLPARWDGTADNGTPVPGGIYILQLEAAGEIRQSTIAVAR